MESSVLLSRFLVARKPVQLFRRETSFTTELALCNKSLSRKNVAHINWEMRGKIKYDGTRNRKKKKFEIASFLDFQTWNFMRGKFKWKHKQIHLICCKVEQHYFKFSCSSINWQKVRNFKIIFPLPYSLSYLTLIRSCNKIRVSKNLDQYNFRFFHSDWDPCTTI